MLLAGSPAHTTAREYDINLMCERVGGVNADPLRTPVEQEETRE